MKLCRYGPVGHEKPGLVDADGCIRDLSGHIADITPAETMPAGIARLQAIDPLSLPLVDGEPRYGVPVRGIGKFIAVGLNYADHAAESNLPVPPEPIFFTKAISCLVGPNDDVMIPRSALKTDWEVELGIIIGTTCRYVEQAQALDHVAGYVLANDVSERAFQKELGSQWDKGKGCDTFGPVGPWLVTPDEVGDVQTLDMFLNLKRHAHADWQHAYDDLPGCRMYCVCQPLHHASSRRSTDHRHPARRRRRQEAGCDIPEGWRHDASRRVEARRAAPDRCAVRFGRRRMNAFSGRFAGRTAIVTGGASGLGKMVAARIIEEGGTVALWDLNADALAHAKDEMSAAHVEALDVSDLAAVERAARASHVALGKVDILIASAGITGATVPVQEFPVDSWLRVMDINVNGLFYCNRTIVPLMLAKRLWPHRQRLVGRRQGGQSERVGLFRLQGGSDWLHQKSR